MPYVSKEARSRIDAGGLPQDAGELNYVVTQMIDGYLCRKGGLRYAHINEVIGVLECLKLGLYRRVAAPYEDAKRRESGDVYDILREPGPPA